MKTGKRDSVQIHHSSNINDDTHHASNSNPVTKKPWSFRFRKPSFTKKDQKEPLVPLDCVLDTTVVTSDPVTLSSYDDDEYTPVFIQHLEKSVKCLSGDQVILQCVLSTSTNNRLYKNDPPVIFWKDAFGHLIRSNENHTVSFSEDDGLCSLRIHHARLSDSGRYTCTAVTDGGSASTTGVLSVTPLSPPKPGPPQVISVLSESVSLVWSPMKKDDEEQSASIVKFFTVEHCIAESDMWTSCAVVDGYSCQVHHLVSGQMYSFRIIAHGEGRTRSDPSDPSEPVIVPVPSSSSPNSSAPSTPTREEEQGKDFHRKYVELEDLNRGRFSVIRKCQEVSSGKEMVVKCVPRKRWKKQFVQKEFQILSATNTTFVVSPVEFYDTLVHSVIVMEM